MTIFMHFGRMVLTREMPKKWQKIFFLNAKREQLWSFLAKILSREWHKNGSFSRKFSIDAKSDQYCSIFGERSMRGWNKMDKLGVYQVHARNDQVCATLVGDRPPYILTFKKMNFMFMKYQNPNFFPS